MDVKLVVVGGDQAGKAIPIRTSEFLIGRGEECHLRPHSKSISRKHCAIVAEGDRLTIEDFGSTNGTFVNGERLQQRRELNNGDRIKILKWEFELQVTANPKGKARPIIRSVQEAAARAAAAAASDDVLDIEAWLEEDEARQSVTARAKKPATGEDTATGSRLKDTVVSSTTQVGAEEHGHTPAKSAGQSAVAAKPGTDSASSAVNDMLRRFFSTKR